MNCIEFSQQVTALTTGSMLEASRDEYLAHAGVCAGCDAALRGRRATLAMERLPVEQPPAGLFERIATDAGVQILSTRLCWATGSHHWITGSKKVIAAHLD